MKPRVIILGAGLTGMSAGYQLGTGYRIYERSEKPGGLATTIEEAGYKFDCTGHLLHLRDRGIRKWVENMLEGNLVHLVRKSRVFSHGVYTRYPYQANTFGLPPQIAFDCLYGYFNSIVKDNESNHPDKIPQNFEEYCLKFFGEGFSKHFMIPYNSKLWGLHPREITSEWCERFVPKPQLEDVIAGAVGLNDRELGYNKEFLYPVNGIGMLSERLFQEVSGSVRFQSFLKMVDWRNRRLIFDDHNIEYDVLISTIPLDIFMNLLLDPSDETRKAGILLRCKPLYYIDVALDVPCGMDFHWVYVPEAMYPFYRVGCYSNFSDKLVPKGKSSLYVELSSRETPIIDRIMPEITQGLIDMHIIHRPNDILFARVRHLSHAYVVFDHNYYQSLSHVQDFLDEQQIISCGRYGGWNYSSMEDALISGRNAAKKARKLLQ